METHNLAATPGIRTVEMNRASGWIKDGFNHAVKFPMPWVIVMVGAIVVVVLLAALPLGWLSGPLATLLGTVLIGEMMRHCRAQDEGAPQASRQFGTPALWTLGAIAAGLTLVLNLIGLAMGVSVGASAWTMGGGYLGLFGLVMLIQLALSLTLAMALWLAPALVALDGMAPVEAVKLSFNASFKNLAVFIVFAIISMILSFFAALPLGLGLLLLVPVLICATYVAYKELFTH